MHGVIMCEVCRECFRVDIHKKCPHCQQKEKPKKGFQRVPEEDLKLTEEMSGIFSGVPFH